MTNGPEEKEPSEDKPEKEKGKTPKPKGMGGVFIIFLLLLTLFYAVSGSGRQGKISYYDWMRRLYLGQFDKVTETPEGQLIGTAKEKKRTVQYETTYPRLEKEQREEIVALQARELEITRYTGANGLKNFLEQIRQDKIRVIRRP